MNYMLETVAFEEWFETHSLSISAQLLWHKLMYLNYKNGWDEWVQLDNKSLMKLIEVKNESTLIRIRKELVQAGLIVYQMGKKGSPSRYKIKSILEDKATAEEIAAAFLSENNQPNTPEAVKAVADAGEVVSSLAADQVNLEVFETSRTRENTESATISIQKDVKNKLDASRAEGVTSSSAERAFETPPGEAGSVAVQELKLFEKFFEVYPRKKSKALASKYYIDIVLHTAEATEEKLLAAAENYAKECKKNKTKEMFIKMAHNWLKDLTWIDYLPGNYKEQEAEAEPKPEQKREKIVNNRFNNIEQRKYDFNELEKALLGV